MGYAGMIDCHSITPSLYHHSSFTIHHLSIIIPTITEEVRVSQRRIV